MTMVPVVIGDLGRYQVVNSLGDTTEKAVRSGSYRKSLNDQEGDIIAIMRRMLQSLRDLLLLNVGAIHQLLLV